jgi:hypothetical protein
MQSLHNFYKELHHSHIMAVFHYSTFTDKKLQPYLPVSGEKQVISTG